MKKIQSKKELRHWLSMDFERYPSQKLPFIVRWLIKDEQTRIKHYIWVLRNTEYNVNRNSIIQGFWQLWYRRLSNILNIHINLNCCGPGLRLVHIGGGIYLNANTIGSNFTATTGVVIGKKGTNDDRPYIGCNVEFTLGAKAYGGITIEDNCIIAPNSVVFKSIPMNSIVSGVPGVIIKSRKGNNF